MDKYDNIPLEVRQYDQWVCWKHERDNTNKLTKRPYNAIENKWASPTKKTDWCSFERAVKESPRYDGIGFVLTQEDPFCIIDLDDPFKVDENGNYRYKNPTELSKTQIQIFKYFDSYSEKSPSERGLHIVCRGSLPTGRNKNGIEVYPHKHFLTFTGDVFNDKPIRECQEKLSQLWAHLEASTAIGLKNYSADEIASDEEVLKKAYYAVNQEKFEALWNGDINTYHGGDHSAADFALMDILAFYTQNRAQLVRLFRKSALGQRPKALRDDYVNKMIDKSFDRVTPSVDIEAYKQKIDEEFKMKNATEVATKYEKTKVEVLNKKDYDVKVDDTFTIPPGLVGEIATFIYQQSPKPVKQISTVGALGLMAGICGKAFNVSGLGLNLYMLLLAGTGRGKEAMAKGIDKIFKVAAQQMPDIKNFSGPGDLASGQGLLRYFDNHPHCSFVSVMGEFGIKLKSICTSKDGNNLILQKVLLDAYSKSGQGQGIGETAYSERDKNTKRIEAPAFSLVGESVPKWFYENLNDTMINTGLLPRFLIIEYLGKRVKTNENHRFVKPSPQLIEKIWTLATIAQQHILTGQAYEIDFEDKAMKKKKALDKKCDEIINDSEEGTLIAELWNRCNINTMKVASLLACGKNPNRPIIDEECWDWAEKFVGFSIESLKTRIDQGLFISRTDQELEQYETMERVLFEYLNTSYDKIKSYKVPIAIFAKKIVTYGYLSRRCIRLRPFQDEYKSGAQILKVIIDNMIKSGILIEIPKIQAKKELDFSGVCYTINVGMLQKNYN